MATKSRNNSVLIYYFMSKKNNITDLVTTGTEMIQNPTALGIKLFKSMDMTQKKTVAIIAGIGLILWALSQNRTK